jgi:acyl-CoA reductase-like NAD-dependent aldehyde dehydrogenase
MAVREPIGVVAGITPFNVPLVKAVKQSAVALAVGNTFVLLPSEEAPRIAHRYAQIIDEAGFPPGVFNVVTGLGHEIGDYLTGHPLVKCVCFCGSTRVGRHIAKLAAEDFKKTALELGGKSPMVVLDDADIDKAVEAAAAGIFFFQGQACMGTSRIILQEGIAAEFTEKFCAVAKSMKLGELTDPQTAVGPIISERQRGRVRSHIDDAKAKGATVRTGGLWEGNRCQPTVLSDVSREMTIFAQETFGPVTALYTVKSVDEAIALANETEYGLSAAVFTNDLNHAMRLTSEIKAGMIHVNAASLQDEPHVPFGGMGISGYGREGTETDIDLMTEWKWVTFQLPPASPEAD